MQNRAKLLRFQGFPPTIQDPTGTLLYVDIIESFRAIA